MRFFTDENVAKSLVKALRDNGYNVKDVKEEKLQGISDKELISCAKEENRIILTHDKDFILYPLHIHCGVVVIKYENLHPDNIIKRFIPLLETKLKQKLAGSLTVVKDKYIRLQKSQ